MNDEPRLIDEFRARWQGQCSAGAPCRAAGKVAAWSLGRMCQVLQRGSARPLRIAERGAHSPTPHELALLSTYNALAAGEDDLAREHARWLVRGDFVGALLRAMEPIASGPARKVLAA